MRVEELLDDSPEACQWERHWFSLAQAARLVQERGLAILLRRWPGTLLVDGPVGPGTGG